MPLHVIRTILLRRMKRRKQPENVYYGRGDVYQERLAQRGQPFASFLPPPHEHYRHKRV